MSAQGRENHREARVADWRNHVRRLPAQVRQKAKPEAIERLRDLRIGFGLAVQAGVAGALAWVISNDLLGNEQPIFAPIVAVGTLISSAGQRLRSVLELVIGIVLGIGVGDIFVYFIGTGAWQLAVVVPLAMIIATVAYGPGAVVVQAAHTSVLIVALSPVTPDLEAPRIVDALVGGSAALLVGLLLLPLNPVRVVTQEADPLLTTLADQLSETGRALKARKHRRAQETLSRLREIQDDLPALHDAIEAGRETANLSPLRWRRRAVLRRYGESGQHLHRVTHNSGALARRAVTMIEDDEPVPEPLPEAIRLVADAIRVLHHELSSGLEPQATRLWVRRALFEVGRAQRAGLALSGSVVAAQIRTICSDLLRAAGLNQSEDQANQVVRAEVSSGGETEQRIEEQEESRAAEQQRRR